VSGKLPIIGKVEHHAAQLGALGHPVRLATLRYVVQAGHEGAAAGAIQAHVDMPASTLSHHLKRLVDAGIIRSRGEGTYHYYSAAYDALRRLTDYLWEDPVCAAMIGRSRTRRASRSPACGKSGTRCARGARPAPAGGMDARMILRAESQDLPAVLALLAETQLPTAGVAENFDTFFVVDDGNRIVACAGLELHGDAALVRSLAVAANMRCTGIGTTLLRRALYEAAECPLGAYALTTTAEAYLARFGFERVPRGFVPQALFESRELQDACPGTALVMKWRPSR